jgi:hypothetical protein
MLIEDIQTNVPAGTFEGGAAIVMGGAAPNYDVNALRRCEGEALDIAELGDYGAQFERGTVVLEQLSGQPHGVRVLVFVPPSARQG